MRRRRGRARPGDHAEPSPETQDPLQAALDRYSYRPAPSDVGQQPTAGRQPYGEEPQPYQNPQSQGRHGYYRSPDSDRDSQAYRGRHSPATREPHQVQQEYPTQQAYPGHEAHPAQQPYPGQQAYPAREPYPGQQTYPGQPPYPGEQHYPGHQPYPGEQRYQGEQPYPGQQWYPPPEPYQGQRSPGVFQNAGESHAQYEWLSDQQPYAGEPQPLGEQGPAWPQQPQVGQPPLAPPPPAGPQQPVAIGQRPPGKKRWWRRRVVLIVVVVVVLIAGAIGAGGAYLLLRTKGSPQQTAAAYLRAWQRGNYRAMAKVSLGVPRSGIAGPLTRVDSQLGVRSTTLRLGKVTGAGRQAEARFTVADRLASNHTWHYHGRLRLVTQNRRWWVKWSLADIYPMLKNGEKFRLTSTWPTRAPILGADGTVISSPAAVAQSGSIALLTGIVGPATAAEAKQLGAPYRAGDPIGLSGIQQAYQDRLAGSPALTIKLVGPGKHSRRVQTFSAVRGRPVKTSIMMSVQLAAAQAVLSSTTNKPIDMVVIQPSTGRVLAMVERPGSWDKAIDGTYPPGSTFKIVTASALAEQGMTPSSTVQCPSTVTIGGYTIHNDKNEQLGTTTLLKAFAISCNTTFAKLATDRLTAKSLGAAARLYGFNAKPALGIAAQLGSFTRPNTSVDLAADAFGQGKDLVSPLSQASEVAAVESGTWRPPLLVLDPRPKQTARPHVISQQILKTLRPMMNAVVTIGTASGVGFPPDVYGKTGTAEYGTGPHPKAHGWFIGYHGNLAFAVLVEGGGYGANSAGPIANFFVRHAP